MIFRAGTGKIIVMTSYNLMTSQYDNIQVSMTMADCYSIHMKFFLIHVSMSIEYVTSVLQDVKLLFHIILRELRCD